MPTFWRVLEDAPLLNAESLEVTVIPWGSNDINLDNAGEDDE